MMETTMSANAINVLLIDDHALFREGLRFLLSQESRIQIVGVATDGLEGVKLAKQYAPDVVLLDLEMPLMNGFETLTQLRNYQADLPVLILTLSEEAEDLKRCLSLGAQGYILKNVATEFLINAVFQVAQGNHIMSQEMTNKLVNTMTEPVSCPSAVDIHGLTEREREVLNYIAKGISNKLIASHMGLAENTIKVHVQNILKKLRLNSRVQAAIFANKHQAELDLAISTAQE